MSKPTADPYRVPRNRKKLVALLRAKDGLRRRFDAIDFEYDQLIPARDEFDENAANGRVRVFNKESI